MEIALQIGDLVKFEYTLNDDNIKWYRDIGVVVDIFVNTGNQEFAEVLWETGKIDSIYVDSLEKINGK